MDEETQWCNMSTILLHVSTLLKESGAEQVQHTEMWASWAMAPFPSAILGADPRPEPDPNPEPEPDPDPGPLPPPGSPPGPDPGFPIDPYPRPVPVQVTRFGLYLNLPF